MLHSTKRKYLPKAKGTGGDIKRGDDANSHQVAAREHLKRCDELLEESGMMLDALEETLAKTPRPSELLGW